VKRYVDAKMRDSLLRGTRMLAAALMLAILPAVSLGQAVPGESAAGQGSVDKTEKQPRRADRRRAAKLYLEASKAFEKEQYEAAMHGYEQAAGLDPGNRNYSLAAEVARSHQVTALIQSAAKARLKGEPAAARAALAQAQALDPKNIQVTQHLYELGDDAIRGQPAPIYAQRAGEAGEALQLVYSQAPHSFHMRTDQRQAIQQVFKAYGVEATLDSSINPTQIRLDLDDASFEVATRVLGMLTNSFYVALDPHRVLAARDTRDNRMQYTRQELETVYLSGLSPTELTDVANLAKNVFDAPQSVAEPSAGTITLRAPETTLTAFNNTMQQLLDGRNQVLLDVQLIQIAHTSTVNTGIQPPQQLTAVNAYAAEQSILNANQSLVQQIISSGLASPGDTLAILGILLASGQVTSSLFSNGIALFGGGKTLSGLSTGPATMNLNLNSSNSRELDNIQLRLGDGEAGTLKEGERYPIQTSSFSGLSNSVPNIPGLTGAGSSSSLSSLLASYGASVPNVPQVEYQDLGLTLKATPNVMRSGDVALTIDLKIDALAGTSINGNPVLTNRAYSGVVTLKQGEGVVVVNDLDKQESRAVSGLPGLSEIPGLNEATDNDRQKSLSTLVIVMTPHVIRGTQAAGHSPMMRIERGASTR